MPTYKGVVSFGFSFGAQFIALIVLYTWQQKRDQAFKELLFSVYIQNLVPWGNPIFCYHSNRKHCRKGLSSPCLGEGIDLFLQDARRAKACLSDVRGDQEDFQICCVGRR